MSAEFLFGPDTEGPVRVRLQGESYPHRHLWYVVLDNLRDAIEEDPERLISNGVAALLVTHSCFEAYLNFAGELLFEATWDEHDRLRVEEKLKLIARELSVELDKSRPPLQAVMELNRWRNRMVHARIARYTEVAEFRHPGEIQNLTGKMFDEVTEVFIGRARDDVKELCDTLQAEAHRQHPVKFIGPGAFEGILGQAGGNILRDEPDAQGTGGPDGDGESVTL